MARKKVRDIYGNWVYEDARERSDSEEMLGSSASSVSNGEAAHSKAGKSPNEQDSPNLEWRDWLALTFALLQTTFLPVVILMIGLLVLAILFTLLL